MKITSLPNSRKEAVKTRSIAYYTGLPCKHGHIDSRYTNTGICYQCKRNRAIRDYKINPSHKIQINKKSYQKNKEKNQEARQKSIKDYKAKHREKYLAANREYERRKRENPLYRLSSAISLGIWRFLKQRKEYNKWQNFVNFTLDELVAHLESQFVKEMTWENYGTFWEVDHVKPKSKCDTLQEAWQLSNLQPLTITQNRQKYNKWNDN